MPACLRSTVGWVLLITVTKCVCVCVCLHGPGNGGMRRRAPRPKAHNGPLSHCEPSQHMAGVDIIVTTLPGWGWGGGGWGGGPPPPTISTPASQHLVEGIRWVIVRPFFPLSPFPSPKPLLCALVCVCVVVCVGGCVHVHVCAHACARACVCVCVFVAPWTTPRCPHSTMARQSCSRGAYGRKSSTQTSLPMVVVQGIVCLFVCACDFAFSYMIVSII